MAFIPDEAILQKFKDGLSPSAWDFYQFLCSKRNHETRRSQGTIEKFASISGIKRATKFALLKELIAKNWITGEDGNYELLTGDFTVVNERADKRKQSKNSDSKENKQSKILDKSKKIGSETPEKSKNSDYQSKILDSHIRNNQLSSPAIPKDSNESFGERERTPEPISENEFLKTYKEFYPAYQISIHQQEIIESRIRDGTAWRTALIFWSTNDYRPKSVGKICDKYDEILAEKENGVNKTQHRNGYGQPKRKDSELSDEEWYEQNAHLVAQ